MSVLSVAMVDLWWGNDDPEFALGFVRDNQVCRGLQRHGFEPELLFPAGPGSRPNLVLASAFGPRFGNPSGVRRHPEALGVFWCNENLHGFEEFAPYRDHEQRYDFSFTYDPTTSRNFQMTGAKIAGSLGAYGQPLPPAQRDEAISRKTDFACFLYSNGGEEQEGVRLRNDFCRRLAAVRPVNCGGSVMNNVGGVVPRDQTGAFVARHRFTLAMENTHQPGYVTEKTLLGFNHRTIPVYCGAPDIARFFDGDSYLHYTGDNFDEVVDRMCALEADPVAYAAMLSTRKLPAVLRPEQATGALQTRIAAIAEALHRRGKG